MSGLRLLMMLCAYSTMFCPILPHLGPIANWPAGLFYHFVPPLRLAMKKPWQGPHQRWPDWQLLYEPRSSFLRELCNSREFLHGAMHPPKIEDWKVMKKAMKKPTKKPMQKPMKKPAKKTMKKLSNKPMKAMKKEQ